LRRLFDRLLLFRRVTNNTDASSGDGNRDANSNVCNNNGGTGANNATYANDAICANDANGDASDANDANDAIYANEPFRRRLRGLVLLSSQRYAPRPKGLPLVLPWRRRPYRHRRSRPQSPLSSKVSFFPPSGQIFEL
jgi:hypothetical protein